MRKPHSHVSTYKHFKQGHLSMGLMGSIEPTNFQKFVLKHIIFCEYEIEIQYYQYNLLDCYLLSKDLSSLYYLMPYPV